LSNAKNHGEPTILKVSVKGAKTFYESLLVW
jgi:hypothetical protein